MSKNFSNSDIFAAYAQQAIDKGLISLSEEEGKPADKRNPDKTKKKLESTRRADSLTQERIEKLYNLKPDAPEKMKYERNMVDIAHKDSVYIAPAYDKLNALVENVNQRQDAIINILNKKNNGLLTQHKYAVQELAKSLVRIGNDMDNKDEAELRSLADECLELLLEDTTNNIVK